MGVRRELEKLQFWFRDPTNDSEMADNIRKWNHFHNWYKTIPTSGLDQAPLKKAWIHTNIKVNIPNKGKPSLLQVLLFSKAENEGAQLKSVLAMWDYIVDLVREYRGLAERAGAIGMVFPAYLPDNPKAPGKAITDNLAAVSDEPDTDELAPILTKRGKPNSAKTEQGADTKRQKGILCYQCGGNDHKPDTCRHKASPWVNTNSAIGWMQSKSRNKMVTKYPCLAKYERIPATWKVERWLRDEAAKYGTLDIKDFPTGTSVFTETRGSMLSPIQTLVRPAPTDADECGAMLTPSQSRYASIVIAFLTIVPPNSSFAQATKRIRVRALIDTGALQGNYCGRGLGDELLSAGAPVTADSISVCSPIDGTCSLSTDSCVISCVLHGKLTIVTLNQPIKVKIVSSFFSNLYELVIGLPTIRLERLVSKLMISQLEEEEELVALSSDPAWRDTGERGTEYALPLDSHHATKQCLCRECDRKSSMGLVNPCLSSVTVGGTAEAPRVSLSRRQSHLSSSPPTCQDIIAPVQTYNITTVMPARDLALENERIEHFNDKRPIKVYKGWKVCGRTSDSDSHRMYSMPKYVCTGVESTLSYNA